MDKDKILDYVMNTPGNSNRAVLSGMLDEFGSGGGGSGPLIVTLQASGVDWIFDKTFTEVKEAFDEGRLVLILSPGDRETNPFASIAVYYSASNTHCIVITSYGRNQFEYVADSADGYPKYHWND